MDRTPLRSWDIRERNEKLVLSLIYKHGGISQSEVATLTGLKPPTVFRIFSTLEQERYIQVCEKDKEAAERKGRKPVYYRIAPDAHYALGLDFWSRSAAAVIVDFERTPIYENVINFDESLDAKSVLERLQKLIADSIQASTIPLPKILGIGVGAPGVVNLEEGSVTSYSRIRGMAGFNLKEPLEKAFGVPVWVHNNSSVIAMSEYRYGQAKGLASVLLVLIRSGVGGSFIQQGALFVSGGQTAVEIGHLSLNPEGRPCPCGQRGCLEAYLSEDAILADLKEGSSIRTLAELDQAIAQDKPEIRSILETKGDLLGHSLANLYNLLRPQGFLIVSRSRHLADFLAKRSQRLLSDERNEIEAKVLSDHYDPILAGRGATDLVFDAFFQVPVRA